MPYIEWQDSMETGIAPVDSDHKVLVSLINQVHSAIANLENYAILGSILRALAEYTDYHFQREEKLMEDVGFDGVEAHKALHIRLTEQVKEIIRRFEASQGSVRAQDVQNFLQQWLVDHILHQDMRYKPFVQGKQSVVDAVEAIDLSQLRGVAPSRAVNWNGMRALVVDDNANFRLLMETVLSGVGMGVVQTADSAKRGLELLSRQPFDLVITDWMMDGMDGIAFVESLRHSLDPVLANVGIIMVTSHSDSVSQAEAKAAGVDEFLEKPVSPRALLKSVSAVVNARRH